MGGCPILGYVSHTIFPDQIKAAYELQDRPTVIVVDDPSALLNDQAFLQQVAHLVGVELVQRRVLSQVIPGARVVNLATRLGDEFGRMPIDRVGKELGAEQVLHVNVESIDVSHARMTLLCQVKVIDAAHSVRLFPTSAAGSSGATARSTGRISVQLVHATTADVRRGERVMVGRDLGRRVSIEVARLFADHEVPQSQEPLRTTSS